MQNGFAQVSTATRLAIVAEVEVQEIALPDIAQTVNNNCVENVIEFIKGEDIATLTLSQGRYISKVKKLAEERPEECKVLVENKDGSIVAHVPVSWVKINPPKEMSESHREQACANLSKYRSILDKNG